MEDSRFESCRNTMPYYPAVFSVLTAIFAKIGVVGINSNLATISIKESKFIKESK